MPASGLDTLGSFVRVGYRGDVRQQRYGGPLYTLVFNQQVRTADRSTQLSIFAVIMDVTSAGASLAYGRLADYSLSGAFILGAGVCALSGAAILVCRKYFFPTVYPGSDSRKKLTARIDGLKPIPS